MYKTALVSADIEDGRRVVQAFEKAGLRITAAFWFQHEDEEDWNLVIVSPDVATKGSTRVYKELFAPLHNLQTEVAPATLAVWWERIQVTSPASLIYQMVKQHSGLSPYIYKIT